MSERRQISLGGTPVFAGTRVPAQGLIDYLEAGHPLDHCLDEFPSVSREHAVAVLERPFLTAPLLSDKPAHGR